jgi:hypothetical protein
MNANRLKFRSALLAAVLVTSTGFAVASPFTPLPPLPPSLAGSAVAVASPFTPLPPLPPTN